MKPICERPSERGLTMIELLIAVTIALVVALAAYEFLESSRHTYVTKNDMANAQSSGRAGLDLMSSELRGAGYSPLGVDFDPIRLISATEIRLMADLDGDGSVGVAGELNENVTYRFEDPDGDGAYDLIRGADLNDDGDFADSGESADRIVVQVVPIDGDDDGTNEPFIDFVEAAPLTSRITLSFGVQTAHLDRFKQTKPVVNFQTDVKLRNQTKTIP